MTDTKRITVEQVEEILRERVDWIEALRLYVFGDYGDFVNVHDDGVLVVHGSGTHYRDPEAAGVVYGFRCAGFGNLDTTEFAEGFAEGAEGSTWTREHPESISVVIHTESGEEVDASDWIEIETGWVIGDMRAVAEEAIENGDHHTWVEEHIQAAAENHERFLREVKLEGRA